MNVLSFFLNATLLALALFTSACSLPKTLPPQADTSHKISFDDDSFKNQTVQAHIIALHSFGDNHHAFDHWQVWAKSHGYALHHYDQRGFGHRGKLGRWYGSEAMVSDAISLAERIRGHSDKPIYLMGESMGGAIAILAAVERPQLFRGLILAAPAVREGILVRYPYNAALNMVASISPSTTASIERDPDNPELISSTAQRLAHSPHTLRDIRMDTYRGLIRLADLASDQAPKLHIPVLLFYGGQDESVPEVAIKNLRRHWQGHVTYVYQSEWPHLIFQSTAWKSVADTAHEWRHSLDNRGKLHCSKAC